MYYIAKSKVNNERNWSGKEFSDYAAKLYHSTMDLFEILQQYWYSEWARQNKEVDNRHVIILQLTEKQKDKLLSAGKVRF